jgi:hypothetical protein
VLNVQVHVPLFVPVLVTVPMGPVTVTLPDWSVVVPQAVMVTLSPASGSE